jgi:hypothetical protein
MQNEPQRGDPDPGELAATAAPAASDSPAPASPADAIANARAAGAFSNPAPDRIMLDQAAAVSEHVRLAEIFCRTFIPNPDPRADYKWVIQFAKDQYTAVVKNFDDIDGKAASLIGYFGGGAGAIAVGALAGVLADKTPPLVAAAAVPSFVVAMAAVILATLARQRFTFYLPNVRGAAEYANDLYECAEIQFVGQWVWATALTAHASNKRARYYNRAIWCAAAAIGLLLLPMLASLMVKFGAM